MKNEVPQKRKWTAEEVKQWYKERYWRFKPIKKVQVLNQRFGICIAVLGFKPIKKVQVLNPYLFV